jgi:hypothetical protein
LGRRGFKTSAAAHDTSGRPSALAMHQRPRNPAVCVTYCLKSAALPQWQGEDSAASGSGSPAAMAPWQDQPAGPVWATCPVIPPPVSFAEAEFYRQSACKSHRRASPMTWRQGADGSPSFCWATRGRTCQTGNRLCWELFRTLALIRHSITVWCCTYRSCAQQSQREHVHVAALVHRI